MARKSYDLCYIILITVFCVMSSDVQAQEVVNSNIQTTEERPQKMCTEPFKGSRNEYISAPNPPTNSDDIAQSVVSFGYVFKNVDFLPVEMREKIRDKFNHTCTVTIVAKKAALMAAHCFEILNSIRRILNSLNANIPVSESREDLFNSLKPYVDFYIVPDKKISVKAHKSGQAVIVDDFFVNPMSETVKDQNRRKAFDTGFIKLRAPTNLLLAPVIDRDVMIAEDSKIRQYGYSWPGQGRERELMFNEVKIPHEIFDSRLSRVCLYSLSP